MTQGSFRKLCKLSGLVVAWVVLLGLGNLQAQTFTVTATQYSDRIQFVAQGEAKVLRAEIFSIAGQKLFDSGVQPETTAVDWRMLNRQGRPVPNGVYLYAITVKDASGKTSQHLGKVAVRRGQEPVLSTPTVGELNQVEPLSHNLNHCEIRRSNGGRIFIRPLGCRLGVGTDDPQAKLDVITSANGTIAIQGTNNGDGTGVAGFASSSTGIGVIGHATATSGNNAGVFARTNSAAGAALKAANGSGVSSADVILGCSGILCRTTPDEIVFRVKSNGNVIADGSYFCPGPCSLQNGNADVAERIDSLESLRPGDVVEIDPTNARHYRLARSPYSTQVAGIISTQPGVILGNDFDEASDDWEDERPALALVGTVPVKVSAESGAIHPGDLLTTSGTPGHAMKCQDKLLCIGAILGKALEPLEQGTGVIRVLVTLR